MVKFEITTEEEGARFWIGRDFSMIPGSLIERAFKDSPEDLELLAGGEKHCQCCDEPVGRRAPTAEEVEQGIEADERGEIDTCERRDRPCDETRWGGAVHGWPAAHSYLFSPNDRMDEDFIRDNADTIADTCGFLIYEADETGIVLGIDGGGYSFFDQHWIPLYRFRGLRWHVAEPAPKPAKRRRSRVKRR